MMCRLFVLLALLLVTGPILAADENVKAVENVNQFQKKTGTWIGIDLGTSYSCFGVFKNGQVEIIANEQGSRITPSYVAFTPGGDTLIGDFAKSQLTMNAENTVFNVKRLIGRNWDEILQDIQWLPYTVVDSANKPHIQVEVGSERKTFTTVEISAMVLAKIREIAGAYLDQEVTGAVISVPANFNSAQRQATIDAAKVAGLIEVRLISEPAAAAIAFVFGKSTDGQMKGERNILVYDLGGGSFDVSVVTIERGIFQVVATGGDTQLGGGDFNQRIMDYFIRLFRKRTGKDLRPDKQALQKLRREVERAKRLLSTEHSARLEIESLYLGMDFSETLTRARFEELNMDLFRRTLECVRQVLKDSDLKKQDIAEIVLVGGSTRIPMVQQLVKEFFDGREPNRGLNPDEAVAYGAVAKAGSIGGADVVRDLIDIEIYPWSLGLATEGGVMTKLIPRNTVIPTMMSQVFFLAADNHPIATIHVFEGERPMIKDNRYLGKFEFNGISRSPHPLLNVTFEIDADGILNVTARESKEYRTATYRWV